MHLTIFCDGASRGNPGPSAYAFIVKGERGQTVFRKGVFLGKATNNEAEYQAVIGALRYLSQAQLFDKEADNNKKAWRLDFKLDSQLVAQQLSGRFKVKDQRMSNYLLQARALENNFLAVSYQWINREDNKEADWLVKQVLDENLRWN